MQNELAATQPAGIAQLIEPRTLRIAENPDLGCRPADGLLAIQAEQFDKPVMVNRYPAQIKAFYMEPDPQRPELALCVDVLAPEGYGEIIGGSQRMASHELLLKRIHEHGLPEEAFKWYLDLRKYGGVPHGGFGMGIERAVAWICGLEHVRETIPFARTLHRLYP